MEHDIKYLALIGQAGSGKSTTFGWMQEEYPGAVRIVPKITTRPARPNEPSDTIPDYPIEQFLERMNTFYPDGTSEIMLPHQPFGEHWYGYRRDDLMYRNGRLNVLEPNPELQLPEFKRIFGAQALVVALISRNMDYLRRNLEGRGTETPDKIEQRLRAAEHLLPVVDVQYAKGNIDRIIEVDFHNRDMLRPTMMGITGSIISRLVAQV